MRPASCSSAGLFNASARLYFAGSYPAVDLFLNHQTRGDALSKDGRHRLHSSLPASARRRQDVALFIQRALLTAVAALTPTAEPATTMEQTRHSTSTTSSVLPMLSLF